MNLADGAVNWTGLSTPSASQTRNMLYWKWSRSHSPSVFVTLGTKTNPTASRLLHVEVDMSLFGHPLHWDEP